MDNVEDSLLRHSVETTLRSDYIDY